MRILNKKIILCMVAIIFSFVFVDNVSSKVIVCFRYDDVSNNSNYLVDKMVIELFVKRKIPVTVAVIPFTKNKIKDQGLIPFKLEEKSLLKQASDSGIVEIALHGFLHKSVAIDKDGLKSEYAFVKLSKQLEKIEKGKHLLESLFNKEIVTFVPPWESYDKNTLVALEKAEFKILSANRNRMIKEDSELHYLPSTCNTSSLIETIKKAQKYTNLNPIVVNVFHEFEFMESKKFDYHTKKRSITYFELILDQLSSNREIEFMSIRQVAEKYHFTKNELLILNNKYRYMNLPELLLPLAFYKQKEIIPPGNIFYLNINKAISIKKNTKLIIYTMNILSFLFFVLIGFILFKFIISKIIIREVIKIKFYRIISIFLFFFAIGYTLRDGRFGLIGQIIIFIYLGLLLGELFSLKCVSEQ